MTPFSCLIVLTLHYFQLFENQFLDVLNEKKHDVYMRIHYRLRKMAHIEARHEKTSLRGFRPGKTQKGCRATETSLRH